MKKITSRKFQKKDVEDVLKIFIAYGLIHNDEERERTRKLLLKDAVEPEWYDTFLVAELDGRVVGRVILEAAYPPYSELINMYVHPDYRSRGVGSSLVQRCIEIASAHRCLLILTMTDPVENLPAHRLYSKYGFRPGILGDPSRRRGHMWLFRFSQESSIKEFIKRHPFAEPSVSRSKEDFFERILYRMSWRDPQTQDKMDLFIEGQPSQTPDGTMPRITGFSFKEKDHEFEVVIKERNTIRLETSKIDLSFFNHSSKPLQLALCASIPNGIILSPSPQTLSPIKVDTRKKRIIKFEIAVSDYSKLPKFTTFPTVLTTFFFWVKRLEYPLFASTGFDRKVKGSIQIF